jgi:hypothetical protein
MRVTGHYAEYDCAVARHGAVFLVKLDGLRVMAGQNWWVLHFRFEYSEHYLAIQRIGSSDLSA